MPESTVDLNEEVSTQGKTHPESNITSSLIDHTLSINPQNHENASTDKTKLTPVGLEGLLAYDESIPTQFTDIYYFGHPNLKSITKASDIVFTGRVTEYREAVLTFPYSPKEIDNYSDAYDGIVFTVEEIIAGELPAGTNHVLIVMHTLLLDEDGNPLFRISESPIEVVLEGIRQRNLPDSPLYSFMPYKSITRIAGSTYLICISSTPQVASLKSLTTVV